MACQTQCCQLPDLPTLGLRSKTAASATLVKCGHDSFDPLLGGDGPRPKYLSKTTERVHDGTLVDTVVIHVDVPGVVYDRTWSFTLTESGTCNTTDVYDPAPLGEAGFEPECLHDSETTGETERETVITDAIVNTEGATELNGCSPSTPPDLSASWTETTTTDCATEDTTTVDDGVRCDDPTPIGDDFTDDTVITEGGTVRTRTELQTPVDSSDVLGTPPNHTERSASGEIEIVTTETLSDEFTTAELKALAESNATATGYEADWTYHDEEDPPQYGITVTGNERILALTRIQWQLWHQASLTGYLKVWLDLEKTDETATVTTTALTPYEWTGAPGTNAPEELYGGTVFSAPDDTPSDGTISWRVLIKKWSLVEGYVPPDDGSANGYPV